MWWGELGLRPRLPRVPLVEDFIDLTRAGSMGEGERDRERERKRARERERESAREEEIEIEREREQNIKMKGIDGESRVLTKDTERVIVLHCNLRSILNKIKRKRTKHAR